MDAGIEDAMPDVFTRRAPTPRNPPKKKAMFPEANTRDLEKSTPLPDVKPPPDLKSATPNGYGEGKAEVQDPYGKNFSGKPNGKTQQPKHNWGY